jgi:hypothetical protein
VGETGGCAVEGVPEGEEAAPDETTSVMFERTVTGSPAAGIDSMTTSAGWVDGWYTTGSTLKGGSFNANAVSASCMVSPTTSGIV